MTCGASSGAALTHMLHKPILPRVQETNSYFYAVLTPGLLHICDNLMKPKLISGCTPVEHNINWNIQSNILGNKPFDRGLNETIDATLTSVH